MSLILSPNRVIASDIKSCTYCCYVRCAVLIVCVVGMPWPKTDEICAQLGFSDKGCATEGLVFFNSWDVSTFGQSRPKLLSTGPRGMNRKKRFGNNIMHKCFRSFVYIHLSFRQTEQDTKWVKKINHILLYFSWNDFSRE